ncbi:MAG TPA: alanine--tRNA ligase-related protein [Candidatus Saccharimonadales bacterium]|nr:alanine--tRNA ligase-related protein [Candidatus Saccharimonadales bacterium]
MAATELLYLQDFDVTTCSARVVDVHTHEDGRTVVVLDQTCFYPRGGGQDWDTGSITQGSQTFDVEEVRLNDQGAVLHIGNPAVDWSAGAEVTCTVNGVRRTINTRLHSAGHLLDMAMAEVKPHWVPAKGAHYPTMSFVEYEVGDDSAGEDLVKELQAGVDNLTSLTMPNRLMFVPVEEMHNYCRHVPENIPTNKPGRIVIYGEDFGVPCGGTHVRALNEIGKMTIVKIKVKKGLAKVSYALDGIN